MSRPIVKEQHHFPFKLYDMLEYAANSEYSSAVSWIENGRAFAIHDKDTFLCQIVPRFFKQTKIRSFTRQLNLWGFTRLVCKDPGYGAWKHKHFIHGDVDGLNRIERQEIKSNNSKIESVQSSSKSRQRRTPSSTLKSEPIVPRVMTPESSSDDGHSVLDTVVQPLIPNRRFQAQFLHQQEFQAERTSPCTPAPPSRPVLPSKVSFHYNGTNVHQPQMPLPYGNANDRIRCQNNLQQTPTNLGMNEDDILFYLSAIFESDHGSGDDDLSSISSLNEVEKDFMNPISF